MEGILASQLVYARHTVSTLPHLAGAGVLCPVRANGEPIALIVSVTSAFEQTQSVHLPY